jgi:hypothetical protein
MRTKNLAAVVLSVCLLSACSEPEKNEADIATLRTAAPASVAPSAAGAPERPVVRPDDGPAEFDRYVEVWGACLRREGATTDTGIKPRIRQDAKGKAAARKCEHLYPETWMEREARTNPDYVDLLRVTAECLKSRGHDVTVGGDPTAIMYGDNTSANKAYDDEQECQREAFRESIEKYRGGNG